ncbi:MAG: ABC transporter ATP-binding protein [bacterium]|nr:ABC transporter ATP-binding protein [bacterium]
MKPAVIVKNVWKQFILYHQLHGTLRETILRLSSVRNLSHEKFWALKDISFEVQPGETLGIIGENGSGKTTLLRIILGITPPTRGSVEINGQLSALLELAAGFHPDLTGKENIYLNGAILGLSRSEISRKIDAIIEFAELEKFIDVPIKHYSAGMYLRLGFSIAVNINPDILLIDEVLAVGDQSFAQKCYEKINEFKRNNKTIILVSHDYGAVERLCNRVIYLEKGIIKEIGNAKYIVQKHLREIVERELKYKIQQQSIQKISTVSTPLRWGTNEIQYTRIRLLDEHRNEKYVFQPGEYLEIELEYMAHQPIIEPYFGIGIETEDKIYITGTNTKLQEIRVGTVLGKGRIRIIFPQFNVTGGKFLLTAGIFRDPTNEYTAYDYYCSCASFYVDRTYVKEEGIVLSPHKWIHEKID